MAPAHITILGGGIVGANAAKVAAGFGADIACWTSTWTACGTSTT